MNSREDWKALMDELNTEMNEEDFQADQDESHSNQEVILGENSVSVYLKQD